MAKKEVNLKAGTVIGKTSPPIPPVQGPVPSISFSSSITTDAWVQFVFVSKGAAFLVDQFRVYNDDKVNSLQFSFDGSTQQGIVRPLEMLTFPLQCGSIYIQSLVPGNQSAFRVFAW